MILCVTVPANQCVSGWRKRLLVLLCNADIGDWEYREATSMPLSVKRALILARPLQLFL